ncbi:MAG: hypothetical protein U5O39_16260 [Gammaproteobacteria bacterium]|nr:hypothetical protein [Gammaproteobacteria bacterium]
MTNITIKVSDDLARAARVLAAERGTSLSRLVAGDARASRQQGRGVSQGTTGRCHGHQGSRFTELTKQSTATHRMSGRAFIDTNVLVYAHDAAAGAKYETAARLVIECWENENAGDQHAGYCKSSMSR